MQFSLTIRKEIIMERTEVLVSVDTKSMVLEAVSAKTAIEQSYELCCP